MGCVAATRPVPGGNSLEPGQAPRRWIPLRWLGLAGALFLLNAALSFHNHWPTPWVEVRGELSAEIVLLVLALAVAAKVWGPPSRRVTAGLAMTLTVLAVGRYAAVTVPALYGRPINLFWDAQHLPGVAAMLVQAVPLPLVLASVLALLLLVGGIYALMRWALGQVGAGVANATTRRVMMVLAGAALAAYLVGLASPRVHWEHGFSLPVTATYAQQVAFVLKALEADPGVLPPSPRMQTDLARVQGAHVVILFAESYGAVTFDQPQLAATLAASRTDLAAALAETGRRAVSAFVRSPTFGGNSWLAHASLLSGVEVTDAADYDLLLTQRRETLVQRFANAGYRTLAIMPGLRQAWPEGAFYDFDAILGAQALDYRGPALGWWRIPDQFALARFDAGELATTTGPPRFAVFPTINSHIPFRPIPPYQPDWDRMLTPQPFDDAQINGPLAKPPDLSDLGQAYAESLAYLFHVLAGWLRERSEMDLVLLVLGDHQPPAVVSGEGAPWEVPAHLITGRTGLADALAAQGFFHGLTPRRPALGNLPELTRILLRAFGSGPPVPPTSEGVTGVPGVDVPGPGVFGETSDERPDLGSVQPSS
jgi:hypothetical protein